MKTKSESVKTKSSRRKFLKTAAAAAVVSQIEPFAAAAALPQNTAANPVNDSTLILTNGRIHTLYAANAEVSSVTIRNGRFVSAGNTAGAQAPNTRVIDLKGRTVVPGLVEAHIHTVSLANRPGYHTILENTTSIREIQEALAARRKDVPDGQWI